MKTDNRFASKISNNGTAKVSAASGKNIYIVAITSADASATTLTFADDADLGVLELPAASAISFQAPIRCSSFTPSDADISVVYYEARLSTI
tara:strand:+ start:518 stop:793 length:276 start_codon:yes stop_codon:yes gene_type:complete